MCGREEVFDKHGVCVENLVKWQRNTDMEQRQVKCTESAELKPEYFEMTNSVFFHQHQNTVLSLPLYLCPRIPNK